MIGGLGRGGPGRLWQREPGEGRSDQCPGRGGVVVGTAVQLIEGGLSPVRVVVGVVLANVVPERALEPSFAAV